MWAPKLELRLRNDPLLTLKTGGEVCVCGKGGCPPKPELRLHAYRPLTLPLQEAARTCWNGSSKHFPAHPEAFEKMSWSF